MDATQAKRFGCSVTAGLVAGFITNPTETIRVRWQVLSMTSSGETGGLLQFARRIIASEECQKLLIKSQGSEEFRRLVYRVCINICWTACSPALSIPDFVGLI
eukprot:g2575.t1